MAVFGKKNGDSRQADVTDFVRIPQGTRLAVGPDGKLKMSFAGDMSIGEELPELSELICGRNLSIDPGVTIRAQVVRVKEVLEIEESARLITRELEAERIVGRKGRIEARTITAGRIELEGTDVIADRIQARDSISLNRGDQEIGTIVAQILTVEKGTNANVLIAEVGKLEGAIPKGGYKDFGEFLGKIAQYHPELLNEKFVAEARKLAPRAAAAPATGITPAAPVAAATPPQPPGDPVLLLARAGQQLRGFYQGKELGKELATLVTALETKNLEDVRRELTPAYQRVSSQSRMPDAVTEVFRDIQRALRDLGPAVRESGAA